MKNYDILIIGAGPIGLACGLAAKRVGLSYVIIEKGTLVNSLYNYPANMSFFSTSDRLEIGNVPFVSSNAKPNRGEALEYYRRVADSNQLNIKLFEAVESVEKRKDTEGSFDVGLVMSDFGGGHDDIRHPKSEIEGPLSIFTFFDAFNCLEQLDIQLIRISNAAIIFQRFTPIRFSI